MMREEEWQVTLITASAHYLTGEIRLPVRWLWRRDIEDGTVVIRTWTPRDYRSSHLRRALTYLAYSGIALLVGLFAGPIDVVFTGTDPPFMTPSAYLLSRIHRSRLVLDERDVYPDTSVALGMNPSPLISGTIAGWNRWLRRRSDAVITVSPGLKKLLIDRGANPRRLFVLPNYFGTAADDPEPLPANQREPRTDFTALYAGSLGQATHVETILQAARLIQEKTSSIRFLLLGAGERREEYIERSRQLGLGNVEFPGIVPRSGMPRVFASTTIALHSLPSHPYWENALSSKVLEYLAYGKPVVFAGRGDIADVLEESGGGIVVPPEDGEALAAAIMKLKEEPQLLQSMSHAAVEYVRSRFGRTRLRDVLVQAFKG